MKANHLTIKLSTHEVEYLTNSTFLSKKHHKLLDRAKVLGSDTVFLKLTQEIAEEFRNIFTEELARSGFDENYDVTSEGVILENLIDRFYFA